MTYSSTDDEHSFTFKLLWTTVLPRMRDALWKVLTPLVEPLDIRNIWGVITTGCNKDAVEILPFYINSQ